MMGVATNIVAARPILPSVSKQQWPCTFIQLIASSTLIFFYLMLFVQVSVEVWLSNKEDCEQDRARVSIISSLVQYIPCPWTGCCHEI